MIEQVIPRQPPSLDSSGFLMNRKRWKMRESAISLSLLATGVGRLVPRGRLRELIEGSLSSVLGSTPRPLIFTRDSIARTVASLISAISTIKN